MRMINTYLVVGGGIILLGAYFLIPSFKNSINNVLSGTTSLASSKLSPALSTGSSIHVNAKVASPSTSSSASVSTSSTKKDHKHSGSYAPINGLKVGS